MSILIHPIKDYLILKPFSFIKKKKSSIIISESESDRFSKKCMGTILEIGPDVKRKFNKKDILIFNPNEVEYLMLGEIEYVLVKESFIVGIIKK